MATAQELYNLARRNQATMRRVETLLLRETNTVLGVGAGFGQQEMGGFLRTVVPELIDRFGNINATAAVDYYNDRRNLWIREQGGSPVARQGRQNLRRQADRRATAELRSQVFLAKRAPLNPQELAEGPIGYGMKLFQQRGFSALRLNLGNAMTRAVASYNRDTILYNSALDSDVVGVQRVAEPGACGFCRLRAVESVNSRRTRGIAPAYAVQYHDNCRCSIETLYRGDQLIKPEYYRQFESEYDEAAAEGSAGVISRMNRLARST